MSIKKVVIVGGAGFLGSHIAHALAINNGVELSYADIVPNSDMSINYLPMNLLEPSSIKGLADYDVVINCTGQVSNPFNLCYRLNTKGILNLLKSLGSNFNRVIQISTTAVYGSGEYCDEMSAINPETNYATAKAVAEFQLQAGLDSSRLTILRLSNLYGPGQQKGIAAYLLRSNASDRLLKFNNDGTLIRYFLHVQDAARVIAACVLESKFNGIYNVKGPDSYLVKDLINVFEKEFNMEFNKEFSMSRPWENIKNLDDSRIHKAMGLYFKHNILKYFRLMMEDYKHD